MSETPRGVNPEAAQTPAQEKKADSFSLSKMLEYANQLTPPDFENLESAIKDGMIKPDDVAIVRKAVEAMLEVKANEDRDSALKKQVPNLVDLIHARNIVDGLIEKTEISQNLSSSIYHLVDAVYEVAPEEVRTLATDAVLKTVDEELKAVEDRDKKEAKKE